MKTLDTRDQSQVAENQEEYQELTFLVSDQSIYATLIVGERSPDYENVQPEYANMNCENTYQNINLFNKNT